MKTFGWSGVSNTPKTQWYLEYHGFKNKVLKKEPNTLKYTPSGFLLVVV
jgi:hypothetical protein